MSDLINNRKQKHIQANNGQYPLSSSSPSFLFDSYDLEAKHHTIELTLAECSMHAIDSLNQDDLHKTIYTVCGRIKAIRKSGGIAFVRIQDSTGNIQLILTKKSLGDISFATINNFDIGDIIESSGQVCLTKAGEKSILLNAPMLLLSKCLLPLPEKWVGLTDKEAIYKQRYLDLISNDESVKRFKQRNEIIKSIREYLDSRGFMEVETSMLQKLNSGANAKPFITHHNDSGQDMYLRIAPELNLKRLIVGGLDRVYEIGKSFRNEGVSSRHNPEFTMLEFYQAYGNFDNLLEHCENLILQCKNAVCYPWNCNVDFSEFKKITMLDAVKKGFKNFFGFCLKDDLNPIGLSYDRLAELGRKDIIDILSSNKTFGQKLFELFEILAEPFLAEDYRNPDRSKSFPVVITDYPAEICPLARKSDKDSRFCDRFEMYIEGIEVANGYQELNDPEEQRKRFEEQLLSNKKDAMDLDNDYIAALSYGMPPTIGFGFGIDRVVMLLTGAESIKDVILFPSVK